MADIVFVAIALAFFALCASYVRWCDRIIEHGGPGGVADERPPEPSR
jgi:hypothetical protein